MVMMAGIVKNRSVGIALALVLTLWVSSPVDGKGRRFRAPEIRRRTPLEASYRQKTFRRNHVLDEKDDDDVTTTSTLAGGTTTGRGWQQRSRWSIANMTCDFLTQPLNHFFLPRDRSPTFRQRFCVYDGFVIAHGRSNASAPMFLYTGNESPLPEYINNTGLMWEFAEEIGALVVFIEHRYEGESLPSPEIEKCLAYSSSFQALADYATFLEWPEYRHRPVVAFGGSYGGMLSAWLRMKYPHLVVGAIAGSAPIFGFPRNIPANIDGAWQVVTHGLEQSYPPTAPRRNDNRCVTNLLAAWPLMYTLGEKDNRPGRQLLTSSFRLCNILENVTDLVAWAQSPWFDLAEGSFPYSSGYIVYALTHDDRAQLPPWPLQAACWKHSRLHEDFGIQIDGDVSNVRYKIQYGDSDLEIRVDWDRATASSSWNAKIASSQTISNLLTSVRDAVSVWFNVSHNVPCYKLEDAPNRDDAGGSSHDASPPESVVLSTGRRTIATDWSRDDDQRNRTELCRDGMRAGSWPSLCCNEEMILIITEARGLGKDCFWPPTHPRGTASHADVIAADGTDNDNDAFCADPTGIYGFPQSPSDPWATWMDTVYGGRRIGSHSNIVFSNGLLDPWSAAGVYASRVVGGSSTLADVTSSPVPGLHVQNLSRGMLAVVMEYGGHHTDLMYGSVHDPPSITEARRVEKRAVLEWLDEWRGTHVT